MENQLSRRGGRVYILLIRYKVNPQTLELLQSIDQRLRGPGKARCGGNGQPSVPS